MSQLLIRGFAQSDMEWVCDILKKAGWANRYINGQKKAISKLLLDEEGQVFVATISSLIVGYIQVQHHRWNGLSQLHGLIVLPNNRKQGIARKLVEYIETQAKTRGNRGVYLDTPVDNSEGRAFYEKIGYKECYIMPEFYEPNLDGVTYMKLFDSPTYDHFKNSKDRVMNIQFEKASLKHVDLIFEWLAEPHMIEFWDNSQEHKDDILNFIHNRPQNYFYGTTMYWIGSIDDEPYCFLLSDILKEEQNPPDIYKKHMSKSGTAISLDFGIGNKKYLGIGLAAPTLEAFVNFYHKSIDPLADSFFIDPDENNPRAQQVYSKAGFEQVGEYEPQAGAFKGSLSWVMVKKI